MKKFFTAVLALALVSLSALPAHAQMFRQAMADNVFEQNIPNFRNMGLMGSTGMDVNLEVAAQFAYEMATRDGSLATLPEEFRREAEYKTKFRTINGLTDRTMQLDQFRVLVNGQGIRLLRASDFEVAAPAPTPIVTAPVVSAAPVVAPAPVVSTRPIVAGASTARVSALEERVASAEAAARQGRVTPAQLAELQALRTELNQAKADVGSLTTTAAGLDGRLATVEGDMATDAELTEALKGKANAEDVGISVWGWVIMIFALVLSLVGVAAYGRTVRLGKRVTNLETDAVDGAEHRFGITIQDNMEEELEAINIGDAREFRVEHDGVSGLLRFVKVGKNKVTTEQIVDQTQAMNIKNLRSTIKRHIGAGRVQLFPHAAPLSAAA